VDIINSSEAKKQKRRFFILSGLSTAIVLIISVLVLYIIVGAIVRDIIYDDIIELAQRDKRIYANEIDAWFSSSYNTVGVLAHTLSALSTPQEFRGQGFRDFYERDREFLEIVEGIVRENDYIINAFIGFSDGSIINGAGMRPGAAWYSTNAPWYSAAVEAGEGTKVIVNPYWSQGNQSFTAAIATYLPNLNNVGAVVGASISKDDILNNIAYRPILGHGYRILASSTGEIIFHSNPLINYYENINTLFDLFCYDFLTERVYAGIYLSPFYDFLMGDAYFIAAPLYTMDWILFDIIPASALENPISQSLASIMTPIVLLIIVIYLFLLAQFYGISKRRENLNENQLEKQRIEAIVESGRAKDRFLARMSHEIRTPIAAVLGISEIQLRNKRDMSPQIEEALSQIYNSSKTLLSIVNDILDFSKIESGEMQISNNEYESISLIIDATQLHLVFLENENVQFKMRIDENLPTKLIGDNLRIRQIINNLLTNAFKYTDSGTVALYLKCERENDDNVILVITIQDTGNGMSAEQIDAIKNEYVRLPEHEYAHTGGTGLGIPIVYSLAQLMNASVDFQSEVGKGTTITIRIPQTTVGTEVFGPELTSALQEFKSGTFSFAKDFELVPEPIPNGRVLVVDDVPTNLYIAEAMLDMFELNVELCESGQAAIDKVKEGKTYDIIFMDHMMPELDGIETTKALREMGYIHPIVALTANAIKGQSEVFLQNGFSGFMSKPIDIKILNSYLMRFIVNK